MGVALSDRMVKDGISKKLCLFRDLSQGTVSKADRILWVEEAVSAKVFRQNYTFHENNIYF